MNQKQSPVSRRQWLAGSLALGAAALPGVLPAADKPAPSGKPFPPVFRYCLNTATIRGQAVGIVREVEIAAAAGYDAIEPWMGTIDEYVKKGGSLDDLGKLIRDKGLTLESAIGFAQWIVNDDDARAKGLEQAKRDMDTLAALGGKRIAAPPVGAHDKPGPDLPTAAKRYHELLEIGKQTGIVPQLEVWGFSKTLSRLEETAYVALASRHPQACMLLDVYHLHKGNSAVETLPLLAGSALHVFHMNDYPAEPARADMTDAHRIYPGDGVAPLTGILQSLRKTGFHGFLSLELFNRDYWKLDPAEVARIGLEKMQAVVARAE